MYLVNENVCERNRRAGKLIALISDTGRFEFRCKIYFGFGGAQDGSLQNKPLWFTSVHASMDCKVSVERVNAIYGVGSSRINERVICEFSANL